MSVWRRKALELFPDLRRALQKPGYSIYQLFFDLLPMVDVAHSESDEDMLRRSYGFAEWCLAQKDLWNAAGVAFYEHLFDGDELDWAERVRWLTPNVIRDVWGLWELVLGNSPSKLRRLEALARAEEK